MNKRGNQDKKEEKEFKQDYEISKKGQKRQVK